MQDYHNVLQKNVHHVTSYSHKWTLKLGQQSSLSSYHTTKRAQLQTIRTPENHAQLIRSRCDNIQQVIVDYREQVKKMYPSRYLGTIHKHYRSDEIENLFKNAYSSLHKVSDKRKQLCEEEKKAQSALDEANRQCQNINLDPMIPKSKLTCSNENQKKRQEELQDIKEKIALVEEEFHQAQEIYYENLIDIYQQCRELERERLDQIRQTLIKFTQATHSSDYSTELDTIYEDLLSNLQTQQNSIEDLDFLAQTYRVNTLTKSISSEKNQNDDDNTNIDSHNNCTNH